MIIDFIQKISRTIEIYLLEKKKFTNEDKNKLQLESK
jgi:hypothetical protein